MTNEGLKQRILKHNSDIQNELVGYSKGYEAALNWILKEMHTEEQAEASKTASTGPTIVVEQEKQVL